MNIIRFRLFYGKQAHTYTKDNWLCFKPEKINKVIPKEYETNRFLEIGDFIKLNDQYMSVQSKTLDINNQGYIYDLGDYWVKEEKEK